MNVKPYPTGLPPCNNEHDLFYRYLYHVFQPALEKAWSELIVEPMSGCVSISFNSEGKGYGLYASPCWDGNLNELPLSISDDNGHHLWNGELPFPLNGWTMNVDKDVERYMFTVQCWMKTVLPSVMWNILHSKKKS